MSTERQQKQPQDDWLLNSGSSLSKADVQPSSLPTFAGYEQVRREMSDGAIQSIMDGNLQVISGKNNHITKFG